MDNPKFSYVDGPNAPTGARAVLPLDGSRLMGENAGKIFPLFAPFNADSPSSQDYRNPAFPVVGTLQPGITKFNVAGNAIKIVFLDHPAGRVFFRAMKNNVARVEWIPIGSLAFEPFGKPISPFAGPDSTFNSIVVHSQPTNPTFHVEFDQLQFFVDNTVVSVNFQCWIASGNASFC